MVASYDGANRDRTGDVLFRTQEIAEVQDDALDPGAGRPKASCQVVEPILGRYSQAPRCVRHEAVHNARTTRGFR